MFRKKSVLTNFAKFTGKHLCQILFFLIRVYVACQFIKKSLWHRRFPMSFAKLSRTPPAAATDSSNILNLLFLYLLCLLKFRNFNILNMTGTKAYSKLVEISQCHIISYCFGFFDVDFEPLFSSSFSPASIIDLL